MTSLSVPKNLKRFLPVICLCVGLLLLITATASAQGLFGGAGGLTSPLRSYLWGGAPISGCNDPYASLGLFSAGYNYHSFNVEDGIRFNELRLRYALPLRISNGDTVTGFALAHITDLPDSQSTAFGLASDMLRFGGSWRTRLCNGLYLGARGEYDATRQGGTWFSGGQAAIEMFSFVCGSNLAHLRVTYYGGSAGNQLIFPTNPSGYEGSIGYWHELLSRGPRLLLLVSGYDLNAGTGNKQRGWGLESAVSGAGGLFNLNGRIGYDSVVLYNYTLGAAVNLTF
jgi:hypothetical protein